MLPAAEETGTRQGDMQTNPDVSAPTTHGNGHGAVAQQQEHAYPNNNVKQTGFVAGGGGPGATAALGGSSIEALKTAVAASDPDALTKLLEHIESLKHSNAEMSETLDGIQKKNMEKYHIEVQEKIQPWVTSLNIPEDQKASFLQGIQLACEQGMKKRGIIDFQSNPAFSIACAAAEAHGSAIQSAENFRLQLAEANTKVERIKEEESTNYNNNRLPARHLVVGTDRGHTERHVEEAQELRNVQRQGHRVRFTGRSSEYVLEHRLQQDASGRPDLLRMVDALL